MISRAPKRAYIQADPERRGAPSLTGSCLRAAESLREIGYKVIPFTSKSIARLRVTPETPVKGTTGCVKYLYEKTFPGVTYPNFDVPEELTRFAQRKITHSTLGEIRAKTIPREKLFIKPSATAKLFRGMDASFVHGMYSSALGLPDETPILVQEYRGVRNEMRFFIHPGRKAVFDEGAYYLSEDRWPKYHDLVRKIRRAWRTGPKAYVLDIGELSNPERFDGPRKVGIIEVNCVLTAGCMYALPNHTVAKLIQTGWESYARYGTTGEF